METTREEVEIDRREKKRESRCQAVTILFPGERGMGISTEKTSENFHSVKGWSCDLSADGIRFTCPKKLVARRIMIQVDSPGEELGVIEAEILNRTPVAKGAWEYGARFCKQSLPGEEK